MGRAIANSTSGGTGVGPGANKYRFNIDRSSFDGTWWDTDQKRGGTLPFAPEDCQENGCTTDDVFRMFSRSPKQFHTAKDVVRFRIIRAG
jgi:hypothetical protein